MLWLKRLVSRQLLDLTSQDIRASAVVQSALSSRNHRLSKILTNLIYSGDGIPGSCIQSRMKVLRTKAKGIVGPSNQSSPAAVKSEPATPSKRIRQPTSSTPKKRGKNNKGVKAEHSDDETLLADTPPSSDGQQSPSPIKKESQARISPRNVAKKNYKDITDPFIKLNSSHENLFGDSKSASEDSAGSDGEFEVPKSANNLETDSLFY